MKFSYRYAKDIVILTFHFTVPEIAGPHIVAPVFTYNCAESRYLMQSA